MPGPMVVALVTAVADWEGFGPYYARLAKGDFGDPATGEVQSQQGSLIVESYAFDRNPIVLALNRSTFAPVFLGRIIRSKRWFYFVFDQRCWVPPN